MDYTLDIILLLVFFGMVLIGAVKGFVKSILGMAAMIAAFLLAYQLSPILAPVIYDTFLSERVYETIKAKLVDATGANEALRQVSAVLDSIPAYVKSIAESIGIDAASLIDKGDISNSSVTMARELTDKVAAPLITAVTHAVLFIMLLVVTYILLMIIVRLIDKFFKLPVLKTANRVLGGLLGALKGAILVYLLCVILEVLFGAGKYTFISKAVESSRIMEFISGNNFVMENFAH